MRINSVKLNNSFIRTNTANFVANKQEQKKNFKSSLECFAVYNQISFKNKPIPLYAMDYYGRTKRFESILEASVVLDCSQSQIINALKGKMHLVNGLAISTAANLENEDNSLNNTKLREMTDKFSKGLSVPIYLIDYSGKITRFENSNEAKEKLGIKHVFTGGKRNSDNRNFFVNANELDLRRDNGRVILDIFGKPEINYKKLYKILIEMSGRSSMPVYLIDKNKKAIRLNSPKEAMQQFNILSEQIGKCLRGEILHTKGYVIVNAFDIELRDEKCQIITDKNGTPLLDEQKVADYALLLDIKRKQPVVLKNIQTGEIIELESKKKAAEFFGITRQRLDSVLKTKTEYKGYYIID